MTTMTFNGQHLDVSGACNTFVDGLNNSYEGRLSPEYLADAYDDCVRALVENAHDEWWTAVSPEENGVEFEDAQPVFELPRAA